MFLEGASLIFSGGTFNIAATADIDNLGSIDFQGGTVNDASPSNIAATTIISGGTLNLSGGTPIQIATISETSGTLTGMKTSPSRERPPGRAGRCRALARSSLTAD